MSVTNKSSNVHWLQLSPSSSSFHCTCEYMTCNEPATSPLSDPSNAVLGFTVRRECFMEYTSTHNSLYASINRETFIVWVHVCFIPAQTSTQIMVDYLKWMFPVHVIILILRDSFEQDVRHTSLFSLYGWTRSDIRVWASGQTILSLVPGYSVHTHISSSNDHNKVTGLEITSRGTACHFILHCYNVNKLYMIFWEAEGDKLHHGRQKMTLNEISFHTDSVLWAVLNIYEDWNRV